MASSRTMALRMLVAAEQLIEIRPGSTAFRRRAVSTAYYATFHAIAKLCADCLANGMSRTDPDYERIYRALEHGPMKQAFSHSRLKQNERLRKIGVGITRLQAERSKADYMPPILGLFSFDEAKELVDLARDLVADIESIEIESVDCQTLAAHLLFKDRKQ